MFLVYIIAIWGSVLTHLYLRTQSLCRLRGKVRIIAGLGFYLLGIGYIPARAFMHLHPESDVAPVLAYLFAFCIGYAAVLFTLLVIMEILAALLWLAARCRLRNLTLRKSRQLAAGWWGAAAVLVMIGFISAQATPRISRLEMSIPEADPARFVAISDTHLGAIASHDLWQRTLDAARAQNPDALLFVGDLIDDRSAFTETQVSMIRDYFPGEPVYVVTGNHEGYTGLDYFGGLCRKLGFTWLRQEVAPLSPGLSVGGVDDSRGDEAVANAAELLSRAHGPLLMLAHRPETAHYVRHRPETLVLSGHTHGGQILPTVFLVGLANGGFCSGYYPVGQAGLYVSAGAGVWGPPMRLLAPAEIIVIDVHPEPEFEIQCH
ncbi:MAG: metallophosphoesterase [Planctomycetota bacterium]